MTDCLICSEHTTNPTCADCIGRIKGNLRYIGESCANAAEQATPSGGAGASEEVKLPISADALDASLGLTLVRIGNDHVRLIEVLEDWHRLIRNEAQLQPYGIATEGHTVTVATTLAFIDQYLDWIAEQAEFPTDDLAYEIRSCRGAVAKYHPDHTADQDLTKLRCPAPSRDEDGTRCHSRLYYDRERPRNDMHCQRCGTTWTPAALLLNALSDQTQTIWAYPADIEALIGIPKRTLQRWAAQGIVPRDGTRYDIGITFRTRSRQSA